MTVITLLSPQEVVVDSFFYPCLTGKGGIRLEKQEGDGATPVGLFPLRRVFYRPDRLPPPETVLPVRALDPSDGWCDDPQDALYNQLITLPYKGQHEVMWREDHTYDLVIEVGYNDQPIIAGKGSAIFIHLIPENQQEGTAGCVAFYQDDLLCILKMLSHTSFLNVPPHLDPLGKTLI